MVYAIEPDETHATERARNTEAFCLSILRRKSSMNVVTQRSKVVLNWYGELCDLRCTVRLSGCTLCNQDIVLRTFIVLLLFVHRFVLAIQKLVP